MERKCKKVIGKTQVAEQGEDVIWLAQPAAAAAAAEAATEEAAKAVAWPSRYNWLSRAFAHLPSAAKEK